MFVRPAYVRRAPRACFALALAALLLAACGDRNVRPVVTQSYTVKKGDTLYAIAWRHGLDYRKLARWNNLGDADKIYPGQVLRLYPQAAKNKSAVLPPAAGRRKTFPKASAPKEAAIPPQQQVARWSWPVQGSGRNVHLSPAPGLLIGGTEGQAIKAAASGRVVYTGSGLVGFGQLIIIKHTETFLSAYAHNRALVVEEGDHVSGGQTIAEMGRGPRQQPALYFEIRRNGQPVDPLQYLPQK